MGRATRQHEWGRQFATFKANVPERLPTGIPPSQSQRPNPQPAWHPYIPLLEPWTPFALSYRYFFMPRLDIVLRTSTVCPHSDAIAQLRRHAEHAKFTISGEFSSQTRILSTAQAALSPIHRALGLTRTGVIGQEREKSLSSYRKERVGKTEVLTMHMVATDQHQFDIESAHAWPARNGARHD